jgi:hypothetical protein
MLIQNSRLYFKYMPSHPSHPSHPSRSLTGLLCITAAAAITFIISSVAIIDAGVQKYCAKKSNKIRGYQNECGCC